MQHRLYLYAKLNRQALIKPARRRRNWRGSSGTRNGQQGSCAVFLACRVAGDTIEKAMSNQQIACEMMKLIVAAGGSTIDAKTLVEIYSECLNALEAAAVDDHGDHGVMEVG